MIDTDWITTREAAAVLGVSDRHVRRLVLSGKLVARRRGELGWQRISAQSVVALVAVMSGSVPRGTKPDIAAGGLDGEGF